VAGDLVACLHHGGDGLGVSLQGHAHAEDGHRDPSRAEDPHQAPEARATAVLIERLHAQAPHLEGGRPDDLGEKSLRRLVPVQDAVLGPLLVFDDDLQGEASLPRSAGVGRSLAVADEVAGVGRVRSSHLSSSVSPASTNRKDQGVAGTSGLCAATHSLGGRSLSLVLENCSVIRGIITLQSPGAEGLWSSRQCHSRCTFAGSTRRGTYPFAATPV